MKTIGAIAVICSTLGVALTLAHPLLASAQTVAVGPNNGGGEIVLTGQPCRNMELTQDARDKSRAVYSYTASGTTIGGCYFVKEGTEVHVLWHEGANAIKVYPLKNFAVRHGI
jgi:hypothetical protein